MTEPEEVVFRREEAILEIAKEVVVDFEVVEFRAVKFWNVEEAVVRRLVNVPKPVDVRFPPLAPVKKKFVEEAVVEKKLVVVALVPVAEVNIRFGNVLLAVVVAVKFAATASPTTESLAYGEVVPMPRLPCAT